MPCCACACRHDTLFGGLRKPLIGVGNFELEPRLPKEWLDAYEQEAGAPAGGGGVPRVRVATLHAPVTVETWENERRHPSSGWSRQLLPSFDPPQWSNAEEPFESMPRQSSAFALPSLDWEWEGEWAIDRALPQADADGWLYALLRRRSTLHPPHRPFTSDLTRC